MKKEGIIKFFIYLIWIFLLIVGIADLFINPYRSIIWALSIALLLFIYFRLKKIPAYVNLLLALIVVLNVFGETIIGFYYIFAQYDKLLHFVNPIIGCLFVYYLIKDKFRDKKLMIMFCVFAVISMSVGWELFEFGFDKFTSYGMQGVKLIDGDHFFGLGDVMAPFDDTMLDMAGGVAGALIFALGFWLKSRHH